MADTTDIEQTPAGQPVKDDDAFSAAFADTIGRDQEAPKADEPTDEKTPPASEPAPAVEKPEVAEAQFDPWNGLSDEQKSFFQSLQHSESSNRGRVSSLNRQLQEARSAAQPTGKEPQGGDDKSQQGNDRAERIKAAAEEYPDAVGPLVEAIVDLQERMEAREPKSPAAEQAPDDAAMEKEYTALATAHPDYVQIGSDPAYANWVGSKSKAIQDLASSYAADDVASVLTLYKTERAASLASDAEAPGGKTDTVAQRRERQLEGSKAVQQRGVPTASGPAADDFGAAFNARAAKAR